MSDKKGAMQSEQQSGQFENPNLTDCPDCGGQVSWYATVCPHCGRPLKPLKGDVGARQPQRKSGTSSFGVFVAVVLAGLVLWYMIAPYTTPVWMQKIGGTIKAIINGEDSYTIYNWDKLNGK